jgi:peptide/nickel transport system permease protein
VQVTALLRRLIVAASLMWLVVTLTFVLLRLAPGDAAVFLVPPGATAEDAARLREELGLDRSMPVQYARWLRDAVSGDLGASFSSGRRVSQVLVEAAPVSITLGALSLALTFLIGVPIGMVQAAKHRGAIDRTLTALTTAAYAAPTFWLALGLVAVFTYGAAVLGLPPWLRLPSFGLRTPGVAPGGFAGVVDLVRHALLPVSILAVVGAAGIARYARTSVLDLARMDFVKTARGKGATNATVYGRHILANVLPSLVVLFALSLPGLLAGSIFVESVFAWPGLGRTTLNAILARDYPVIMGATLWYSGAVIVANLMAELALPLLDPRRETA